LDTYASLLIEIVIKISQLQSPLKLFVLQFICPLRYDHTFINYPSDEIEHMPDETRLEGAAKALENMIRIQSSLKKFKK